MPSKPETVINQTIELLEQAAQICQEQGEYWGQLRLSLNQCYTDCAQANSAIGMALGDTLSTTRRTAAAAPRRPSLKPKITTMKRWLLTSTSLPTLTSSKRSSPKAMAI